MRLPKTVKISGKIYIITKNPEITNGSGSTFKQEIVVGTGDGQTDERVFDTLLHEIAELVACENNYRYGDGHSETSMFVMNHKEFERFISDVSAAIFSIKR